MEPILRLQERDVEIQKEVVASEDSTECGWLRPGCRGKKSNKSKKTVVSFMKVNFFSHNTLCLWVSFSTSLSKHKAHIENPKFLTPGGNEKIIIVIPLRPLPPRLNFPPRLPPRLNSFFDFQNLFAIA